MRVSLRRGGHRFNRVLLLTRRPRTRGVSCGPASTAHMRVSATSATPGPTRGVGASTFLAPPFSLEQLSQLSPQALECSAITVGASVDLASRMSVEDVCELQKNAYCVASWTADLFRDSVVYERALSERLGGDKSVAQEVALKWGKCAVLFGKRLAAMLRVIADSDPLLHVSLSSEVDMAVFLLCVGHMTSVSSLKHFFSARVGPDKARRLNDSIARAALGEGPESNALAILLDGLHLPPSKKAVLRCLTAISAITSSELLYSIPHGVDDGSSADSSVERSALELSRNVESISALTKKPADGARSEKRAERVESNTSGDMVVADKSREKRAKSAAVERTRTRSAAAEEADAVKQTSSSRARGSGDESDDDAAGRKMPKKLDASLGKCNTAAQLDKLCAGNASVALLNMFNSLPLTLVALSELQPDSLSMGELVGSVPVRFVVPQGSVDAAEAGAALASDSTKMAAFFDSHRAIGLEHGAGAASDPLEAAANLGVLTGFLRYAFHVGGIVKHANDVAVAQAAVAHAPVEEPSKGGRPPKRGRVNKEHAYNTLVSGASSAPSYKHAVRLAALSDLFHKYPALVFQTVLVRSGHWFSEVSVTSGSTRTKTCNMVELLPDLPHMDEWKSIATLVKAHELVARDVVLPSDTHYFRLHRVLGDGNCVFYTIGLSRDDCAAALFAALNDGDGDVRAATQATLARDVYAALYCDVQRAGFMSTPCKEISRLLSDDEHAMEVFVKLRSLVLQRRQSDKDAPANNGGLDAANRGQIDAYSSALRIWSQTPVACSAYIDRIIRADSVPVHVPDASEKSGWLCVVVERFRLQVFVWTRCPDAPREDGATIELIARVPDRVTAGAYTVIDVLAEPGHYDKLLRATGPLPVPNVLVSVERAVRGGPFEEAAAPHSASSSASGSALEASCE